MKSRKALDSVCKGENQSVAWYACEAVLGKETYGRLNGRKTGTSVP